MAGDISKGRKKRGGKKAKIVMANYDDPSSPAQAAAVGYLNADCPSEPDGVSHAPVGKASAAEMAAPASAYGNPHDCDDFSYGRLSEGLRPGAAGGGDHGVGTGRNRDVAYRHPDLRQSSTDVSMFSRRTENPVTFIGQAAFQGAFSDTDTPPGADRGRVTVQRLDVNAGDFTGMQPVNPNPGNGSRDYATTRQSATAQNGSHNYGSQVNALSNAVANKSALDVMKETMRRLT